MVVKSCTIICIGNRLIMADSFGPTVFDFLQRLNIPEEVEVIEGGTAGLNLLSLIEGRDRVIFVDTISGFASKGDIVLLDWRVVAGIVTDDQFGHDFGLASLLFVLPRVCDTKIPEEMILVGYEGDYSLVQIEEAARLCLQISVANDFEKYAKLGSQ